MEAKEALVDQPDKKTKLFTAKNLKIILALVVVFGLGVYASEANLINLDKIRGNVTSKNQGLPNQLDYSAVEEVYDKLKNNFDGKLDQKKLENGLREGLVNAAGDPYTEFLNAQESKEFQQELSGSFEGIGAELSKDEELVVIVSPIAGFPAAKAGLKAKDAIVEIDGKSAIDLSITEAVKKIRGKTGTKVKLGIIRDEKRLDFEITRAKISIPSVETEKVAGNIGVIKISRFGEDTVELTREAALNLQEDKVKGVILDLRGNPGGLLDASVGVSSVWLDKGEIVLEEKRGGQVIKTHFASGSSVLNGLPTVVLINEGSASASEIVAGALRDNGAATLLGTKSFGKGSVQEVQQLDFGGILKVTIARWFTPDGVNIDKDGIKPDKKVKITDKDIKAERDPQQAAAIKLLKQ